MAKKPDHNNTERETALSTVLNQIHYQPDTASGSWLGQDGPVHDIATISTGSLPIDIATGIGGFPRGRVVEVLGTDSSGKTTLALTAIANAQASQGKAAFIDAEHALDPNWAHTLGVDTEALVAAQPKTGEQAFEITEQLVRSAKFDIVVIDSVPALTPRAKLEGGRDESHVGSQARLMAQGLRELTKAVHASRTTVVFINQIRHRNGPVFGSPETTAGGNALTFYASMRIDMRRRDGINSGGDLIGNEVAVEISKNKLAPPLRTCKAKLFHERGFDRSEELVTIGVYAGEITRSDAGYAYGETPIGEDAQQAAKWMDDNPEAADNIEAAIRATALPKAWPKKAA